MLKSLNTKKRNLKKIPNTLWILKLQSSLGWKGKLYWQVIDKQEDPAVLLKGTLNIYESFFYSIFPENNLL